MDIRFIRAKVLLVFVCVSVALAAQYRISLTEANEEQGMVSPATWVYWHPKGEKGWYLKGLNTENDASYDVRGYYALRMKVKGEIGKRLQLRCSLKRAEMDGRHDLADSTSAVVCVPCEGWNDVWIPLSSFDYNKGQPYFLKFIDKVVVSAAYTDGISRNVFLKDVCFMKGRGLLMEADVLSRPLDGRGVAEYQFNVTNMSDGVQSVALSARRKGWESMGVELSARNLFLDAGETKTVKVKVTAPMGLPQGAHEETVVQAVPVMGGGETEEISFISVVPVQTPFLIHDIDGWGEVKKKIGKYGWAKKEFDNIVRMAERFEVPEVKRGTMSDQGTEGLVRAYIENDLYNTAVAYYLTKNLAYGQKVAETLRRLTDPEEGYPRTNHLTFQGIPQEGGTMEGLLKAYDLMKTSGLLSEEDCMNIEHTFRLFCHNIIDMMGDGGISNWSVFTLAPAAECALMLHDLDLFNRIAYGPCGLADHLRYGLMDDGWWYEMSLSYNIGCAMCYTTMAWAARSFGIDWLNCKFPASLVSHVGLRPFEWENLQGMAFGKFGPLKTNHIELKRMWDGILIYPDYRGVMFGMGDGHEQILSGEQFELAYFVFRDPRYASVLKRSDKRSLIYGVPELPEDTPELYKKSGASDNAGVAVLRSQTKGRDQREQIQVALKYGTHGGYHGHFDRISLLSLMRYGRSFYNPETSWFGYGSYMYKWWVQPSMSHNMVVVDDKMQEPVACDQLLFHTGEMMQAFAMSADARWSDPPYMGGYDQLEAVERGDAPFVPVEDNHPDIGDIGTYSEPVHQRRLVVVADDYVVMADYLKAEEPHVFDCLLQLRGALPGQGLKFGGNEAQWDTDPLGSGQFITHVGNYTYGKSGIVKSVHHFAPKGADGKNKAMNQWETGGQNHMYNEPGDLHVDAYLLWPQNAKVRIGDYAESWGNERLVDYKVKVDGNQVGQGCFKAWLLGKKDIDVDLRGKKEVQIEIRTERKKHKPLALMMAGAYLETAAGKRVPLSALKPDTVNVCKIPQSGADYYGGPIKIAGIRYKDAIGIEPKDVSEAAILRFDLSDLDAVRMVGTIGCDYFTGDESQVRKTVGVRADGKEARFLTLLEPFEEHAVVEDVKAMSDSVLEVRLKDGRMQRVSLSGFYQKGKDISVCIEEFKDGKPIRKEITGCGND